MRALMAGHAEDRDRGGSNQKHVERRVIPALPLHPAKKKPTSDNKAQESAQAKNDLQNGASADLKSSSHGTSEHSLEPLIHKVVRNYEQTTDSLTTKLASGLATYPSPSRIFVPRQQWKSTSQDSLPDASKHDNLTQAAPSQPSSASSNLKSTSLGLGPSQHTQQALQTSAVELPTEASVSCFSSLNISFLNQETDDSTSRSSTIYSGSPIVTPRTTSQEPTPPDTLNQASEQGNLPALRPENSRRFDLDAKQATKFSADQLDPPTTTNMNHLATYLVRIFDEQIQCDQRIVVDVPSTPPTSYPFEAHKLIVPRSAVLATIMEGNELRGDRGESIHIAWPLRQNFVPHAFSMALRNVYSDQLLSIDDIERFTWLGANTHIRLWRISQLWYTITYWLAGLTMRTVEVERQAEQIAVGLLNWDTIGHALSAAYDLCNQPDLVDGPEQAGPLIYGPIHPNEAIQHINPIGHREKMLEMAVKVGNVLKTMIYSFWTKQVNFQGFHLDTTLEQTVIKPLFPLTRECIDYYRPRVPVRTIQFGQFPIQPQAPEQVRYLSQGDRTISNIMLNLPLADLKEAVNVLKAEGAQRGVAGLLVKNFVKNVVAEREIKRRIVLNSRSVGREERLADGAAWEAVGYKESVLEGDFPEQWEVVAEWEGFL